MRDRIEAVSVCIGYADILRETLKYNQFHFDSYTVVTSEQDTDTQGLCFRNNVHCLVTEDWSRDGSFSKGRCVERGLQHLSYDSWICHLDADIVLPPSFRDSLLRAHLRDTDIHGCDRIMVKSYEDWKRLEASGWLHGSKRNHPHSVDFPRGFDVGSRWAGSDGYVPIGFFQLWHRKGGGEEKRGARTKPYPSGHGSACREDVQHGLQWDRRRRVLIPELIVAHLESEPRPNGSNWHGRTSKPFGQDTQPTGVKVGALTPRDFGGSS